MRALNRSSPLPGRGLKISPFPADWPVMAVLRVAAHLPRLLILGLVLLFAGATLTYGAASRLSATADSKPIAPAAAPTVVVPEVTGQAFVFAKSALEDGGFAWHVVGPVHG